MKRRSFLKGVGGAVGAGAVVSSSLGRENESTPVKLAVLPRRVLGRTGASLPVVGFPGLALQHHEQAACGDILRKAMDAGVDYFDVAPAYGKDGECEIKMGAALEGIPRDKYFLACKTKIDDKDGARKELERSLQRLKTDHFDLYQLHCLQRPEEVAQALGPNGALEAIVKAKEEGKIRHIGFSAHTTKAAVAAMEGFAFDSCMFPINFVEYFRIGFGKDVLETAAKKGTAVISIKPVSRGSWPKDAKKTYDWWYQPLEDETEMQQAMNWVLSQKGVVTTLPASFVDVFERTVKAARSFRTVSPEETTALKTVADSCISIFEREEKAVAAYWPEEGERNPHRRARKGIPG